MKLFASLDPRDRKLLIVCLCSVLVLAVVTGIFARNQNSDSNPMPGSYLTGRHGARAAYDLLEGSGYHVERWEESLSQLAPVANQQTVLIVAGPLLVGSEDFKALDEILRRGGRVLITGFIGGTLLPANAVQPTMQLPAPCKLTPAGLDPLADSGEVSMVPEASWKLSDPRYRVQYTCNGQPAVVEYAQGTGHVVWWAGSTPLENGTIGTAANLEMFLNALGPSQDHNFYWDESLHGYVHSQWFYARGPALNLLLAAVVAIALLVIFSFSRRRGPVRSLPLPPRATQVEFLDALGSLYGKARASTTALSLAWDRFRRRTGELCGRKGIQMNAAELSEVLRKRFPQAPEQMSSDLEECEKAIAVDEFPSRRALVLVQKLNRHGEVLSALAAGNKSNQWRHR